MKSSKFVELAREGDQEGMERLTKNGVNINTVNEDGRTALLAATEANNPAAVKWLIEHGADINYLNPSKGLIDQTPFLYAGANGLDEVLDVLIPHNPHVKILNRYGGNALIPACERGHISTVKKLLTETDVEINLINNLGWTALLEAIILSDGGPTHQEIVRLLLNYGADLSITDNKGVLPIEHARNRGYQEIVQILNDHIL